MKEGWYLIILSIAAILIAISGYYLINYYKYGGSLYVERYEAYFSPDGNLTEKYEYVVSGDYRYLYRTWNAPLFYNEDFDEPFIKILKVEGPCIPYVKDYYGNVHTSEYQYIIGKEAYMNEAGCFCPEGYEKGRYTIEFDYVLYPPVEYDDEFYHMNLKLADKHIPYRNVAIYIDNSSGNIAKIYAHPPFSIKKYDDKYLVEGKSQRNGLIEVELLLNSANHRFAYYTPDIKEKMVNANEAYYFKYRIVYFMTEAMKMLVFFFPLIILAIYYFNGRERKFVVPKYLSFVPKKRKPWLVNLVFKKDAMDFDMDGFYATLLDLQRRGIIEIESYGKEVRIRIKDYNFDELDEYEKKIMLFLRKYSSNGIFSTEIIKDRIKAYEGNVSLLSKIKNDFDEIVRIRNGSDFIINGRRLMLKFFAASMLIFFIFTIAYATSHKTYPVLLDAFLYSILLPIQFLFTIIAPSTLFGRWKRDYYKEKMEWDAFKNFLLDMAHLEKYEAEDIAIWKEWLIYATALGIGKKVAKQFKKLKIDIPEADIIPHLYVAFITTRHTLSTTYSTTAGSHGGGFGAGGGFGGGGAGGR